MFGRLCFYLNDFKVFKVFKVIKDIKYTFSYRLFVEENNRIDETYLKSSSTEYSRVLPSSVVSVICND